MHSVSDVCRTKLGPRPRHGGSHDPIGPRQRHRACRQHGMLFGRAIPNDRLGVDAEMHRDLPTIGKRIVRATMAVTIVVALVDQFLHGRELPTFRAVNFFSYFTVLSNVFAAVLLMALAVKPHLAADRTISLIRGAVTCTWPSPESSTTSCWHRQRRTSARTSNGSTSWFTSSDRSSSYSTTSSTRPDSTDPPRDRHLADLPNGLAALHDAPRPGHRLVPVPIPRPRPRTLWARSSPHASPSSSSAHCCPPDCDYHRGEPKQGKSRSSEACRPSCFRGRRSPARGAGGSAARRTRRTSRRRSSPR